jgi:hypothetical protein
VPKTLSVNGTVCNDEQFIWKVTPMFCPKCRINTVPAASHRSSLSLFRSYSDIECHACGTLLCDPRMAGEFDLPGYHVEVNAKLHRINGLPTIAQVLAETRSDRNMSDQSLLTQSHYDFTDGMLRTIPGMPTQERLDDIPMPLGYGGRSYTAPVRELETPLSLRTRSISVARKRPSPWPIVAFVIVCELVVSGAVYLNRDKSTDSKRVSAAAPIVRTTTHFFH